jgi:myo-inositol-1(or 4)-monophosphatase
MELAEFAADVAHKAAKGIMAQLPLGLWNKSPIEHKSGRELVSRVDREAEQLIVSAIRLAYPDHAIQAEEGGAALGANGQAEYRWIVDPLDGTTNFLHGHPIFCVSVAVERLRGSGDEAPGIVAGAIRAPYLNETYLAARGQGAYLNSQTIRLKVSPLDDLADGIVATGFAYDRERFPNYENFVRVARQARGIRRCGSAAMDLAFVAAGRYEAYWEIGIRSHDVAAGALLVEEAGGVVRDLAGGDDWLEGRTIIASNGLVHDQLRELLEVPSQRRLEQRPSTAKQ